MKNAKIFKSINIERGGESVEKNMGILFLCLTFMLVGCGKEEKPQEAFDTYVKAWNKQKFADMYDQLSENAKKIFQRKSLLRNMKKFILVLK